MNKKTGSPSKREIRAELANLSAQFLAAYGQLEKIGPFLQYEMDRAAIASICTDLIWAAENCAVVRNHLAGKSLNDTMGFSQHGKLK